MATHKPVLIDELYGELIPSGTPAKWQVIHTKPQCEKKLADYLRRNSLPYFLPQLESIRHYKYRKISFTKPMFPGYLFARFAKEDKPVIMISGYVVSLLKVPNECELLNELQQINLGRSSRAEIAPAGYLESGWEVEITDGPLQGLKGIVQSQSRLSEVILQVNILRQAITVKVDPATIRLLREYRISDKSAAPVAEEVKS